MSTPSIDSKDSQGQDEAREHTMQRPQPLRTNSLARLPGWAKAILIIFVLSIVVVFTLLFGPREGTTDNTSGDLFETPTVGITNQREAVALNSTFTIQGVKVKVTKATLAEKFSNDRKRTGKYTVRVLVETSNPGKQVIGIDYTAVVKLVLPSGELVSPKLVSVKPTQLPGKVQSGFFDFPLERPVALEQLTLRFDTQNIPL